MATRLIRFQFLCDKVVEGLNFNHPVPESLVIPLSKIRQESSFADRFRHAVLAAFHERARGRLLRGIRSLLRQLRVVYHNRSADTNVLSS
ncbi:hypothetical protein CDV36_016172 [Fusarium kuroshium]|uniref:Uncharacterized protein n=1 Tax=Fusarium kuroshium TaxID=2010991 RepID=A0A3M2QYA8_9HYPO|nr:hypothetical protein CDV36_016172 [Fusarium kuroshium]